MTNKEIIPFTVNIHNVNYKLYYTYNIVNVNAMS